MKKIVIFLLLVAFAYLAFTISVDENLLPEYGNAKLSSVSEKYISQSVSKDQGSVIFKESKDTENGSANMVTPIVVSYRSFDTLGEVTVLFISALGVSLLVGTTGSVISRNSSGFILKAGAKVILPILLTVGVYVITHGHLTPGGGFQGGAMIASAVLLMVISDSEFLPKINTFKILEGVSGTIYIIIGLIGITASGYFLNNFLPTGTVGELFSAGIIPVIYLFVGLKVGSELTSVITDFLKKEVNA